MYPLKMKKNPSNYARVSFVYTLFLFTKKSLAANIPTNAPAESKASFPASGKLPPKIHALKRFSSIAIPTEAKGTILLGTFDLKVFVIAIDTPII